LESLEAVNGKDLLGRLPVSIVAVVGPVVVDREKVFAMFCGEDRVA
jgi:hypothetical protein